MKYFTGDESGLIKWIAFPPHVEERRHKHRKTETSEEGDEEKKKNAPQPLIGTFGKVDKEKAIQKLQWATLDDQKLLLVARKNGSIQFMNPENGDIVRELKNEFVGTEESKGYFVGLFVHDNHLCTCSSTGELTYTLLTSTKKVNAIDKSLVNLGANLEIMRVHPTQSNIFAIGGKERDLCVYDVEAIAKSRKKNKEQETIEAAGPHKNTSPHKQKSTKNVGLVFQAKNVVNDFLDLQQPIWIHDIQFMNAEGTLIAVATHHHQFRLYDTKEARRPITDVEIGKHPIKAISVGKDFNHILYCNAMSEVGMLDIHTGKRTSQFKGFTGAATALLTVPEPKFEDRDEKTKTRLTATVSLDRFLRVHEVATKYRNIVDKAYLKQRLTCVIVDEEYVYPITKEKTKEEEEEEEEEAMWESMEMVANNNDRKRKHD